MNIFTSIANFPQNVGFDCLGQGNTKREGKFKQLLGQVLYTGCGAWCRAMAQ
jgi:hypothetical protein